MNLIERSMRGIKDSPWCIVLVALAIFGMNIAYTLIMEDYSTSRMAYLEIPTRKVNPAVIDQAAWLPQLLPILLGFMFLRDTRKRWMGVASMAILALDMFTDVWYKTMGLSSTWRVVGLAETFFVYTVGSEVLTGVCLTILIFLLKDSIVQIATLFVSTIDMLREFWAELQTIRTRHPRGMRSGGKAGTPFPPPQAGGSPFPYPTQGGRPQGFVGKVPFDDKD